MKLAVLTGDLVRSSDLTPPQLNTAMTALQNAATTVASWQSDTATFARNRGDGWQLCLTDPKYALRTALYLATALRLEKPDITTRIAVATGAGTVTGDDLNTAHGPAFVASGHALDTMKPPVLLAATGKTNATARLLDHIASGWTQAQARAMHHALSPKKPSNRKIADQLGISRQAVDQALDAAGYTAVNEALRMIEETAP